jgi:acetyl-CoA carboxylase carboxyltransferase component
MESDAVSQKLAELSRMRNRLAQGGTAADVKEHHAAGKLTARERIYRLADPGSFQELDIWGTPMEIGAIADYLRAPADAVAVGYGEVNGRPIFVWAQDATVQGGTTATMHWRKIAMVMEKAIQARVPIVGIIDSLGPRAGDAVQYYRFYSPEAMVRFQTLASGLLPQIALIMGPCVGEMAIAALISDFVFMVDRTSYMHVAFPGGDDSLEGIGDPQVHWSATGCCDFLATSDEDCLQDCRQLLSYLPSNNKERPPVLSTGDDSNRREEELLRAVPFDASKSFSMHRVISLIVDNGRLFEVRRGWAANLITGFARLAGETVGIVANNPEVMGGSLTLDAADKMAKFVRFCDAFNIPLVWFADTPAFLPAVDEETRGLIRHGCKLVFSNVEATVPQITVAVRKLYGGGGVAMPGTTLGGDLDVAWPTVQRGLMGAEGAVSIIYRRELSAIGDEAARTEQGARRVAEMREKFHSLESEWAQDFIDPRDTRPFLTNALRVLAGRSESRPRRKHENMRL